MYSRTSSSGGPTGAAVYSGEYFAPPRELSDADLLVKCCEDEDVYEDYSSRCLGVGYGFNSNPCIKRRNEKLLKNNTDYFNRVGRNMPDLESKKSIKNYCKDSFLTDGDCKLFCENEEDNCEGLYKDYCITKGNFEKDIKCQSNTKIDTIMNLCCNDDANTTNCGNYNSESDFCYDNKLTHAFAYNGGDVNIIAENKKILNTYCEKHLEDEKCKFYCDRVDKPCMDIQKTHCEKDVYNQSKYCQDVCLNNYLPKVPPSLLITGTKPHKLWNLCQKQVDNNKNILRKGMYDSIKMETGLIEVYTNERDIYNPDMVQTFVKLNYNMTFRYYHHSDSIFLSFYIKPDETKYYNFVAELGDGMTNKIMIDNTLIAYPNIDDESDKRIEYMYLKKDNWYPVRIYLTSITKKIGSNDNIFDFKLNWRIKNSNKAIIPELSLGVIDNEKTRKAINEKLYVMINTEYPKLIRKKIYVISYKTLELKGLPVKKELMKEIFIENYNPNELYNNYSIVILCYLIPKYSETYTFYIEHNKNHNTKFLINNNVQHLNNYEYGSKFSIKLDGNKSYNIKISQNINRGSQKLIVSWESATQPLRIIQSDSLAILQSDADTRIEPGPIPAYQKDYIDNTSCCLNDGDSNLCGSGFVKGNNTCISKISDYCITSNMNDKCIDYCDSSKNDCSSINYNYCKQNTNSKLCEDICEWTDNDQFVENVCHRTAQYLISVANQVRTDAEIERQRLKEKLEREKKAQEKLEMERAEFNKALDVEREKLIQQIMADALAKAELKAKEKEAESSYTKKLQDSLNKYLQYLKDLELTAQAEFDKRAQMIIRQNRLYQAQALLRNSKISNDLSKLDEVKIEYAIKKSKVMNLLSTTYDIEAKTIAELTDIPENEVITISAELIYDDKLELAISPDILKRINDQITPIAELEAEKAKQDVLDNPLTYQEILDEIKKAEEEAKQLTFTKEVILNLRLQAENAVEQIINELDGKNITDEIIREDAIKEAEMDALLLGLDNNDIIAINEKSKLLAKEYAKKKRDEFELTLDMEFPASTTYPDRDLTLDMDLLVPVILENMDKDLTEISRKTNIPLGRIQELEIDIIKKIDEAIDNDIYNIIEGFTNKLNKQDKLIIKSKLKKDLVKKFEAFNNTSNISIYNIFIYLIIFIISIFMGINFYKTFNKNNVYNLFNTNNNMFKII